MYCVSVYARLFHMNCKCYRSLINVYFILNYLTECITIQLCHCMHVAVFPFFSISYSSSSLVDSFHTLHRPVQASMSSHRHTGNSLFLNNLLLLFIVSVLLVLRLTRLVATLNLTHTHTSYLYRILPAVRSSWCCCSKSKTNE